MSNETSYNTIKSNTVYKLLPNQTVVEARLMPEGGEIAKILAINAQCQIVSSEAVSGEARYSGRVRLEVMYSDGEGSVRTMTNTSEFADKIVNDALSPLDDIILTCDCLDTDTVSISPTEVRIRTVVEVRGIVIAGEQLAYLDKAPELYTQKEEIAYDSLIARPSGDIQISEETEVKGAARYLMCDATPTLTDVRAGLNIITATGTVSVNAMFYNTDGMLTNKIFNYDFAQEFEADGAREGDTVIGEASMKSHTDIFDAPSEGGEDGAFKFDAALHFRGFVFKAMRVEAIVDAFSVTNEVMITGEGCELGKFTELKPMKTRIEGTAALTEGEADSVLAVCCGRINVANAYADNGRVILEGVVSASVVYLNADKSGISSVVVEVPYSAGFNSDCSGEVSAAGTVVSMSARVRRGNEIELTAEAVFNARCYNTTTQYVLKNVELGGPRGRMCAIAIHIAAPGESIWDVAKNLCTTPETILSQNNGLKLPLMGGERILLYRQQKAY